MTCGTHPPTFETSVHLEIEERQRFGNKGRQRAVRILKASGVVDRERYARTGLPARSD